MILKSSRKEHPSFTSGFWNLGFSLTEYLQMLKYGTPEVKEKNNTNVWCDEKGEIMVQPH